MTKRNTANDFWKHVDKSGDCWIWMGAKTRGGYGKTRLNTKVCSTHRASWVYTYGEIPNGLCVLHKCDVRLCVRPDHLFLGTLVDNSDDKVKKERQLRGEQINKAKLTEAIVRLIRSNTEMTNIEIAKIYGVNHSTIANVRRGKTWKHVKQLGTTP